MDRKQNAVHQRHDWTRPAVDDPIHPSIERDIPRSPTNWTADAGLFPREPNRFLDHPAEADPAEAVCRTQTRLNTGLYTLSFYIISIVLRQA